MRLEEFRFAQIEMQMFINEVNELRLGKIKENVEAIRYGMCASFNVYLSSMWPQLTWNRLEGAWALGWDIGSLRAAMYLMLLFDLLGEGQFLICPECKNPFMGMREGTIFCSPRHRNAYKQRNKRNRKHKEKLTKKARRTPRK